MTISQVLVPPSRGSSPATFPTDFNTFLNYWPAWGVQLTALIANVNAKEVSAISYAAGASSTLSGTLGNTASARASMAIPFWVSGSTQNVGELRESPLDNRFYRRRVAGAFTVDPSIDFVNWTIVVSETPLVSVVATVYQGVAGGSYSLNYGTTQSAATNLLLYSGNFNHASWVKNGITITSGSVASPDGVSLADKMVETAANVIHYDYQTVAAAATASHCVSRYFKAAGRSVVCMALHDGTYNHSVQATFNLSTGATSNVIATNNGSTPAASMVHLGDGWYECKLSGIPNTVSGAAITITTYMNSLFTYLGDGTSGYYSTAAQLETGAIATSRIPTSGVSALRPSGVVYPSRLILPATPADYTIVSVVAGNNIATNIVDPNGQTIEDQAGPLLLNRNHKGYRFQFFNNSWRLI